MTTPTSSGTRFGADGEISTAFALTAPTGRIIRSLDRGELSATCYPAADLARDGILTERRCETPRAMSVTPQEKLSASSLEESHIVNFDNHRLYCRYYSPANQQQPRALVFVSHGLGEHCGRYDEVARMLVQHGVLVFAHDHVGHGRSEGERVSEARLGVYVRDCLQHARLARTRHPELPCFLLGHSMGGAVAVAVASECPDDFAGVILISPLVTLSPSVTSPTLMYMARIMNYMWPRCPVGSVNTAWLSRDSNEVQAYEYDPLVHHGRLSVAMGLGLSETSARVRWLVPSARWPFLLLQGGADLLCDPEGARLFYDLAPSQDKTLRWYQDAYHVLHKELPEVKEAVLKEIESWVLARLPSLPS
ncbi:monoglyceride lipase-like isoform X1 [Petromyzon marinus]|uniref:Monoglyceride lipase-like isoform X1 n=3 Tax=Petromyzon marinus TaxID=7757 RepID=A0AAJ7TZQ2_PETMA|nr:monoglyceride lipase-like isoform X1 [Petromyzon marinus]